jgi:ribonuclease HI
MEAELVDQPLTLTINIDGGSRGNPGPASWAYVVQHDGQTILEENGLLGQTTNNIAEYTALLRALEKAAELKAQTVHIKSDSELLVKQMKGLYKVKNPGLQPLYQQASQLRRGFAKVDFTHVYREDNKEADRLCNEALDGKPLQRVPAAGPRLAPAPSLFAEARADDDAPRPILPLRPPTADSKADSKSDRHAWVAASQAIAELLTDNDDASPEFLTERIISELKKRGFRPPATR